jgi:hypothetical protein
MGDFTRQQRKALEEYDGPVTRLPSGVALGAWFGIINFPEEDLTIPAGGDRKEMKRTGHGRGKTRRYGEFVYVED